jgi:dTMP kinase
LPKGNGFLVSFEGIDKCGKTTQVDRLAKKLSELGKEVEIFREPGSTAISEQVRRILLSVEHKTMNPTCEMLLYSAARAQLVSEKILPALKKGNLVILDRFYHSTIAYQGYGRGLPLDLINEINHKVSQGRSPDSTFILDISPEEAIMRRDEVGRDRIERDSIDKNVFIIDGTLPRETIQDEIWELLQEKVEKFLR